MKPKYSWTIRTRSKKNIIVGVGGKVSLRDINSTSDVFSFQPYAKEYLYDSSLSNYLNYRQQVYAGICRNKFPSFKLV